MLGSTLTIRRSRKEKITHHSKNDSDYESNDNDLEELEALLTKRLPRSKGKYKCKLPLICFKCKKVVYIASRCADKDGNERNEKRENRYHGNRDLTI